MKNFSRDGCNKKSIKQIRNVKRACSKMIITFQKSCLKEFRGDKMNKRKMFQLNDHKDSSLSK